MSSDPYQKLAHPYERLAKKFLTVPRKQIAQACLDTGAKKILDIGCGPGLQCLELLRYGLEPTGLDSSNTMLNLAEKQLKGQSIQLINADATDIPLPHNSMDAAIFSLILHENAVIAEQLITNAFEIASTIFILEWRLPSRNMDYLLYPITHMVERCTGKEHYNSFRLFAKYGGTYRLCQNYKIIHEQVTGGGFLILLGIKKS